MTYDLIVIGGGPAGYNAGEKAAHGGLKTLLIEKRFIGGVCLNEGCVPTKTLLYSAKIYDNASHGEKYGVKAAGLTIDHAAVVARKDEVVKTLVGGIKATLKAAGVTVVEGEAKILGRGAEGYEVSANGETFTAKRLLIATGSSAAIFPIPGLKEALETGFAVTNREILDRKTLPSHLVVIGGGVIGLEMVSYFTSVGTKVTVIEALDHIAGQTDAEIGTLLQKGFEKKGVKFHLSSKVVEVKKDAVVFENAKGEKVEVPCDVVLVSIGRRANTAGIGLESIGVELNRGAVKTDERMKTNVPEVYAAGDVNGVSMLAHTGYREGEVAVNNMLGKKDVMRYDAIPGVIYTNPEVGTVGETEASAKAKGIEVEVIKLTMRYSGRYVAENEGGNGIAKLVLDKNTHVVLGAHAIANYASEFIVSAGIMVETRMKVDDVKRIVFPHPTVAEIFREAAFMH